MTEEKEKLVAFINKKRKEATIEKPQKEKIHWWQKPLKEEDFAARKAKNGKWYVRHKEWGENVWIGAFLDLKECSKIIDEYVDVSNSMRNTLFGKQLPKSIHSMVIDDPQTFF
jgi:hypothetical protein